MTAPRRLFLIRHGPTHQKVMTGWRDVPADLSDAAALARLDAALPAAASVISSDLIRAVATADMLATPRPRLPHDADLREFDFGAWDGLGHEAVAARDPVLSRRFWEEPGDLAPPGGESWNAVTARVSAAIDQHLAQTQGDLIVVCHFGAILTQLAARGDLSPYQALGHRIEPLSVNELELVPGGWRIRRINYQP